MKQNEFNKYVKRLYGLVAIFFGIIILISGGLVYKMINPSFLDFKTPNFEDNYVLVEDYDRIENGIHLATGLKDGEGLQAVIMSCTPCHSAMLVTQNRATKEGWIGLIRWMQETQNLWDLGQNEAVVVNYLATNYAPESKGRREPLKNIDWYEMEN